MVNNGWDGKCFTIRAGQAMVLNEEWVGWPFNPRYGTQVKAC